MGACVSPAAVPIDGVSPDVRTEMSPDTKSCSSTGPPDAAEDTSNLGGQAVIELGANDDDQEKREKRVNLMVPLEAIEDDDDLEDDYDGSPMFSRYSTPEVEMMTSASTASLDSDFGSTISEVPGTWHDVHVPGASHLLGTLWRPLPQGILQVVNNVKSAKESVIEVMKIQKVTLTSPDLVGQSYAIDVEVTGPKNLISTTASCFRKRLHVYGYESNVHVVNEGGCFRTTTWNFECRTLRGNRMRGQLHLSVRVLPGRSHNDRRSQVELARLTATVPFWGPSSMEIQLLPDGPGQKVNVQASVELTVMRCSEVFDAKRCRPDNLWGANEWKPRKDHDWERAWGSAGTGECSIASMTEDMKHDIILVYQTMFCQNLKSAPYKPRMTAEEDKMHDIKVLFLKRLFVCFAVCKVMCCVEENGTTWRNWEFPLASCLCHGSRVLMRLDGVKWNEFLNFLLFGDVTHSHNWEKGAPPPLYARRAASHDIGLQHRTSRLFERKLTAKHLRRNLTSGVQGHHLGMDIPIGGLGNPTPQARSGPASVGPSGVPFKRINATGGRPRYLKEFQHGHVYIRWEDFGVTQVPVLTDYTEFMSRSSSNGGEDGENNAKPTSDAIPGWTVLPYLTSVDHLKNLLKEYGYHEVAEDEEQLQRLYQIAVEDKELALQSSENGRLRCRGVLIHLVIVKEEEASEVQVLAHTAVNEPTEAVSEDVVGDVHNEDGPPRAAKVRMEDLRVPMLVRRRTEPWTDAVLRLCQWQLHMSPSATETVIERCRMAEQEMCMHECSASVLCRHHGTFTNLAVEYQACHLNVRITDRDCVLFDSADPGGFQTSDAFQTTDTGSLTTREWCWMSRETAIQQNLSGLIPPADRLQVIREDCHLSALLLGIEGSAPRKVNCFGSKHSVSAKSSDISAFGKRKWRSYREAGQEVPADLGGIQVVVDQNQFESMQAVCHAIIFSRPSQGKLETPEFTSEKKFFRALLSSSDKAVFPETCSDIDEALKEYLSFQRPAMCSSAGTMVLDTFVRDRRRSSTTPSMRLKTAKTNYSLGARSGKKPVRSSARNLFQRSGAPFPSGSDSDQSEDESREDVADQDHFRIGSGNAPEPAADRKSVV